MIKPEEIRKGLLIRLETEGGFILETIKGEYIDDEFMVTTNYGTRKLSDFSPILITPQWLRDYGFTEVNPLYYKDNHFHVAFADSKIYFGMFEHHIREIKYVHDLQNIYYAITQKELVRNDYANQ